MSHKSELSINTKGRALRQRTVPYPKPGEILVEEFLKPMGITRYRLATEIGVSQRCIGEIVTGKRGITAAMGLRLSRHFGTSEGFWTGLQLDYDMTVSKDMGLLRRAYAHDLMKIRLSIKPGNPACR